MKLYLLLIPLLIFGCSPKYNDVLGYGDPSKWKVGQVLDESSKELGSGFRLVYRSIANSPDFFEGIGHHAYLYFNELELCTCGHGDFSISPSKQYALMHDGSSGKLLLFDVLAKKTQDVTSKFIGLPRKFIWDEEKRSATITFYKSNSDKYKDAELLLIQLRSLLQDSGVQRK